MRVYKLIPKLKKKRHLNLWHKAQEAQWSAEGLDWNAPQRVLSKVTKDRLARILTPVLMSEQSAFHSATALLPLLGRNNEVESQYYLTTWLVDEARHAELFARMFDRIDREPLSARKFPGAYLFQNQVMSHDTAIWLAGLLVVEVLAKKVMTEFRRLDLDPVLSEISDRILIDEARHLGFNRIYVEDRMAEMQRRGAAEAEGFASQLGERLEKILEAAPVLLGSLQKELEEVGFDTEGVLHELGEEARQRMERAIATGQRAGLKEAGELRFEQAAVLGA